ncbi:PheA/TfdB FAD monooxygenase family protein [Pleurotus pulmonarius]
MNDTHFDVLVVGMGPAGLMCALSLAKVGMRTKIIDRRAPGAQYGNADGIQPRTAEIWDSYGILKRFFNGSVPVHAMVTYNPEVINGELKLVRTRPLRSIVIDSRFPHERTAGIEYIEGTLREALLEAGGKIAYSTTPTNVEVMSESQVEYPVKVTLERVDSRDGNGVLDLATSTETIQAKYLVGADGANSWVRRFFDIPLEGDLTKSVWGVADVIVETNFSDCRMKCIITAPTGTIITIPREGEKIRFYVQMSLDDRELTPDGRVDKSYLSSEAARHKVIGRIQAGMSPFEVKFTEIFWWTIFAIPQRVAKQFSVHDRVFIVGDACHQHSPKAGQGANAAMCDSHNLGWKLAHVVKGWASPKILQTYEVERKGYAQELINFDKEISETLESDPESYGRVLHRQNLFTSGLGVSYNSVLIRQPSPSHDGREGIIPGKYLPWCPITRLADWDSMDMQSLITFDGLWRLLIFPGDIRSASNLAELSRLEKEIARCVGALKHAILYTILDNREDEVQWTDVPRVLRSWKRVFVSSRKSSMNVYELLGGVELGAVVLVRPDGYVSMIQELAQFNGDELTGFFLSL